MVRALVTILPLLAYTAAIWFAARWSPSRALAAERLYNRQLIDRARAAGERFRELIMDPATEPQLRASAEWALGQIDLDLTTPELEVDERALR